MMSMSGVIVLYVVYVPRRVYEWRSDNEWVKMTCHVFRRLSGVDLCVHSLIKLAALYSHDYSHFSSLFITTTTPDKHDIRSSLIRRQAQQ